MPYYQFSDSKNKITDHFFPINDAPRIGSEIEIEGKKYTRVPSKIQAAVDIRVDPFDKQKFLEKTNKPGTIGDVFDRSLDLKNAREQITGEPDKIKEKFVTKSKIRRRGKFIDRTE